MDTSCLSMLLSVTKDGFKVFIRDDKTFQAFLLQSNEDDKYTLQSIKMNTEFYEDKIVDWISVRKEGITDGDIFLITERSMYRIYTSLPIMFRELIEINTENTLKFIRGV
jgi:hypothetical protein